MNRFCTVFLAVLTTLFNGWNMVCADEDGNLITYFGTYTGEKSEGIYSSWMDTTTGRLSTAGLMAEATNPSFLAIHPSRKYLYAVSEISEFDGKRTGGVSAYAVDLKSGQLSLLNQQSALGTGPCHLVVDAAGKNVLVANYGGGSVTVLPIEANGRLDVPSSFVQHQGQGADQQRQEAPHAHSINLDPSNRFAFAADLGLDKVLIYRFESSKGLLTVNDPPAGTVAPGSGPRHFAFHPNGKYAFVNNEMTSTVTSFAFDPAKGSLAEVHTLSTLPAPTPGNSTAETVVHPSGKFVYVSNRGHDSLAIFQCDAATGRLTVVGHQPTGGKTPRNFNIDPSGRFILAANQDSNNVVVLNIDQESGRLTPTGHSIEVGHPVCVRFLRLDK